MSNSNLPNRYFHIPNRQQITKEPDPAGRWSKQFPDMIGYKNQGGGKVPEDFGWNTNPKQWQEELTPDTLAKRHAALRVLPAKAEAPALPSGDKK